MHPLASRNPIFVPCEFYAFCLKTFINTVYTRLLVSGHINLFSPKREGKRSEKKSLLAFTSLRNEWVGTLRIAKLVNDKPGLVIRLSRCRCIDSRGGRRFGMYSLVIPLRSDSRIPSHPATPKFATNVPCSYSFWTSLILEFSYLLSMHTPLSDYVNTFCTYSHTPIRARNHKPPIEKKISTCHSMACQLL